MNNLFAKILLYPTVAGAVFYVLYAVVGDPGMWQSNREVVVSLVQQEALESEFERAWQRPPTTPQREEILRTFVREEIFYREGLRLKMGEDDPIIRHRYQQLLESMIANAALVVDPTREQLRNYLDQHVESFQVDSLLTFRQIFFDNTHNAIGADASARFLLGKLQNQDMPADISTLGDPSSLPVNHDALGMQEIGRIFGADFAIQLADVGIAEWTGPIRSDLGLHIVFIDKKNTGRIPPLDDIEEIVKQAWAETRQQAAIDEYYDRLTDEYSIAVE